MTAVLSLESIRIHPWRRTFRRETLKRSANSNWGGDFARCRSLPSPAPTARPQRLNLVAQTLNACGQRTVACGNIGKPLSESSAINRSSMFRRSKSARSNSKRSTIFRPQIAVWLNFAPDHLDRYASVAEYHRAKLRIFEYQTEKEFAVVNASDYLPQIEAQRLTFSAYDDRADFRLADWIDLFRDNSGVAAG